MSLDQVGRRVGLGKTGVQAIESGRSGASLDRYEEIAAVVGAEVVVTVRQAGETAEISALQAALDQLPPDRRILLLRIAQAAADVDDALLRGFVDGLETWARTSRVQRARG